MPPSRALRIVGRHATERRRLCSRLPERSTALPLDDPSNSQRKSDTADSLREQAAACRRLSTQARTRQGTKALEKLGDHFDDQARKIDPTSLRR